MRDLSILIPARNEEFLNRTIQNILENIEANTEIIVILDGAPPVQPLPHHERLIVVQNEESVGQRAATNQAARLSTAKYVMKLDAHCALGKGFDRILIEDMKPNRTVVPRMYNLHAFDWKCSQCGNRTYQGGKPEKCERCSGKEFEKVIVWKEKRSPETDFMTFDKELRVQYWARFKRRPEAKGDIAPLMCCLGACFMMERERYWYLEGMDERHGSWGQMGVEVSCKSWLSGGEMVVNKKTWFAHMFRTQEGFRFPYPNPQEGINHAREFSRDLWENNKWEKAKFPLSYIIDKFAPVPDWHVSKGVLFYTDSELDERIAEPVRKQLSKAISHMKLVSVSLKPLDFGENITLEYARGYVTMVRQILAGLERLTTDIVFFCEHDVLYTPSHFDFTPDKKDVYYYNSNVWRVRESDGHALFVDDLQQLSGLCAYRTTLLDHYRKRLELLEKAYTSMSQEDFGKYVRKMGFEPGTHNRDERVDQLSAESYQSDYPNIDIRHGDNLTPSRWKKEQFRNPRFTKGWTEAEEVPGWGRTKDRFHEILESI